MQPVQVNSSLIRHGMASSIYARCCTVRDASLISGFTHSFAAGPTEVISLYRRLGGDCQYELPFGVETDGTYDVKKSA